MSIIEASSVKVGTMADGTLRLTVDIEPRHAQAAFALFGSPGTAMALAALKTQAQQPAERPKGGLLSQWAALRCQEPVFQDWLMSRFSDVWVNSSGNTPTEKAAATLRAVCAIESRADLDNNEQAAERFHQQIRGPWQKSSVLSHRAPEPQ